MAKLKRSEEEQRSYNMSRVKNKNTSIEVAFRKALWHNGIRYRKNYSMLPGKPDIAITKHRIVIFCDGEFWHGKDWDIKKLKIKSNQGYWNNKIEANIKRDNDIDKALRGLGWVVLRFWGKDIVKNPIACVESVKETILQVRIDARPEVQSEDIPGC